MRRPLPGRPPSYADRIIGRVDTRGGEMAVYAVHTDALGTPQAMTDAQGATVWSAVVTPFGQARVTVATLTNNVRLPGQYFDVETGLS